jgi:hypothetical protein
LIDLLHKSSVNSSLQNSRFHLSVTSPSSTTTSRYQQTPEMAENLEAFTGHLGLGTNSAGTVEPTSSIPGAFPKDAPPSPVRAPVAVAGMFTNDRGDLEKSNQWFVDHAKDEGIVVIKVTKSRIWL